MNTMTVMKALGATGGAMFALDMLWLGVVAKGFYGKYLGSLLRPDVKWVPALLFYSLYVVAVVVFVVLPAAERKSLARAMWLGAFFGLAAYGTYDLTSMALIRDFPLVVVVVDMIWGLTLTTVAATAGYLAIR